MEDRLVRCDGCGALLGPDNARKRYWATAYRRLLLLCAACAYDVRGAVFCGAWEREALLEQLAATAHST